MAGGPEGLVGADHGGRDGQLRGWWPRWPMHSMARSSRRRAVEGEDGGSGVRWRERERMEAAARMRPSRGGRPWPAQGCWWPARGKQESGNRWREATGYGGRKVVDAGGGGGAADALWPEQSAYLVIPGVA